MQVVMTNVVIVHNLTFLHSEKKNIQTKVILEFLTLFYKKMKCWTAKGGHPKKISVFCGQFPYLAFNPPPPHSLPTSTDTWVFCAGRQKSPK